MITRSCPAPTGVAVRPRLVPAPYRRLFAAEGAAAFTGAGFLARLALAMSGVATVVMVSSTHGSYALAGLVTFASLITTLVTMPWLGRLVDRFGQARVAVPAAVWSSAWTAVLVVCAVLRAPAWALIAASVLSTTAPNVGAMARARWAEIHDGDAVAMHRANSFEQVLDEVCFVVGPVLAVGLATSVAPWAGKVCSLVLTLAGTLLFAAQRRTEPPVRAAAPGSAADGRSTAPLRQPGIQVMTLTFLCTGAVFGSLELVTVAFTESVGHGSLAGVVLGLQAAGSAVSGLLFGVVAWRGGPVRRFLAGVAGMAVLMLPLTFAGGLGALVPLMFLAGAATSPTMITGTGLVQELVPRERLNEGMTLTTTALLGGIALGSAVAGWFVERHGPGHGYALPAVAAVAALAVAAAGAALLRRGVRGVRVEPAALV
ncbi:MFS transporter [Streptomyces fragilis]|uniref:MFS transporter n=1 Tax=Streptomyces fragilis TaxID=67301 RepID=A0ABV2YF47_9ACTN|nr:MFS transporter [Streptomyces fragilis]